MEIIYALLGLLALIIVWLIFTYNGLISRRNQADEAWSDIDVQLKRRYNLIPNLVETVKAYAKHESSVFEKVTTARAAAMGAKTMEEHAQAENMLSNTLKSLFAVAEAYPDLKASNNFMRLQDELTDAEDKIQAARRFYNNNVRIFNTKLQKFPANMVAGMLGFKAKEFFEAAEGEKELPRVAF
ncbi:MAG: LemA family protein [Patescibacteria group bacterium]|nr:LemA family protein [Patescibacteria group bacterium]MDD5490280.1 LemA family protein [Patescibacteria group bacterium]